MTDTTATFTTQKSEHTEKQTTQTAHGRNNSNNKSRTRANEPTRTIPTAKHNPSFQLSLLFHFFLSRFFLGFFVESFFCFRVFCYFFRLLILISFSCSSSVCVCVCAFFCLDLSFFFLFRFFLCRFRWVFIFSKGFLFYGCVLDDSLMEVLHGSCPTIGGDLTGGGHFFSKIKSSNNQMKQTIGGLELGL